jgi:hypothetical protein
MAKKKTKAVEDQYRDPRDFEGRDDAYIIDRTMKDIKSSEDATATKRDKYKRQYMLYRSYITPSDRRPNGANLFIPYVFSIVETAVPKIIMAMMKNRPFLAYKPISSDDVEKAKKMTNLVDFQIHNKMRAVKTYVDIVKSCCMYGTAISKQGWKFETKKFVQRKVKPIQDPMTGEVLEQKVPVLMEGVSYDAPEMKNIPLEDFFYDPFAMDIPDARYCGDRTWTDLHKLKDLEKKGVYKNIDKITNNSNTERTSGVEDRLNSIGDNNRPVKDSIEIHEYWTEDWKVVIANRSVVIQCVENPYFHRKKPYSKWIDIPVPNEFEGIGEIEICENLQYELNTTRNQRIDNVSFGLNRMYKILRSANIDPNQLVSRPNGFIELDDMGDVEELEHSDVSNSGYNEEQAIKADMNDVTGIHNQDRGAPTNRRETATTATIMAQGSTERFTMKVTLIEDGGFADSGMQIAELNKQFVDRDTEIRILGKDEEADNTGATGMTETITPEDMDVELDLVAVGSAVEPSVNKEIRQNQLIQMLNVATAGNNAQFVNIPELLKEVFRSFDIKDVEKYIVEPPPVQPGIPPEMGMEAGLTGVAPAIGGMMG